MLQDIFKSQIQEQLSFHKIGTRLIEKKLKEKGITLNDDQLTKIESWLLNLEGNAITITIDEERLPVLNLGSEEEIKDILRIDLSNFERDIEELFDRFTKGLSEVIPEVVEELSELILKQLKQDAPSMLRDRKKERNLFEARMAKAWRKPLDLLEMFLAIALEVGDDFNREFRLIASQDNDWVFEVLTRLHARACQIGSEVLTLLRAGHADGAHARWRSLHEIAVIGFFVKSGGNELAERYLLHDAIESYKAAKDYQEHCRALGYEPLSEDELNEIRSNYQHLVDRFGNSYKEEYGWAAAAIGKNRPTFRDIEKAVELDHLRPFYKLASHNVHANPKGVFFKLGLFPGSGDVLLAGPSMAGLADPGHGTAISLAQITTALLPTRPNIDRLVVCDILTRLGQEVGEEFLAAHQSLERE
jgi:hypothetical protein